MGIGLALVAVVFAGPLAGIAVGVTPDLLYIARRGTSRWNLGLVANLVGVIAPAFAAAAVLRVLPAAGPLDVVRLFAAGAAMLLANYLFARLLLAVLRDGARPGRLLRTEFLRVLPLESVAVAVGVASALLMPEVGVLVLVGFAGLVYIPQLAVAQLLSAPSVAALSVDAAAAIYRDALADELGFSGAERRHVHIVDALAERRALPGPPANSLAAVKDALLVTICLEHAPTQREFSASLKAQVVLVSRRWAELTARCTPALSHREALSELRSGSLADDAPLALIAARRIADREYGLSEHIAGVPRLHRTPLPRGLRRRLLPWTLAQLAAEPA